MSLRRGTLFLVLAWAAVLITGYALTLVLTRTLDQKTYGDYGLVMSVLLWLEIIVINGIPYAVQKFTASHREAALSIFKSGLFVQTAAAVALYGLAFALAPLLSNVFQDNKLTLYFRIAFLNVFVYGFLHLLASFQNGLGRFGRQAFLLTLFAFGKMGFVILFVALGRSLVWAFWGNAAGAMLGIAAGILWTPRPWKEPVYDPKPLIRFAAPSVLYSLAVTLILTVDLWFVNRGLGKEASAVYVASSQIARIPYFLVFGLSAAVLPTAASAIAAKNLRKVRNTIEQAFRFLLMLSLPTAILATLYRREVVSLLFPSQYAPGSDVLGILIWGMTFLALLVVMTTVINADGRPGLSFLITSAVVVLDMVLNAWLVPRFGIRGAAAATTAAVGAGAACAFLEVKRRFRFSPKWKSVLRIALAALVPAVFGLWVPATGLRLVLVAVGAAVLYGLVLAATREIRKDELMDLFRPGRNASAGPEETMVP